MKILAECKAFLAALKKAAKFTDGKSTVSAFRCVKISAGLHGSDAMLEENIFTDAARFRFPATLLGVAFGYEELAALFEPGPVMKLLAGVDGIVTIETPREGLLQFAFGSTRAEFDAFPAADFAAWLAPDESAVEIVVSARSLARAIEATVVAAGDEVCPARHALRMEFDAADGKATIAATDGRRLHFAMIAAKESERGAEAPDAPAFNFRNSTARKLAAFLGAQGEGADAMLRFSSERIVVRAGGAELAAERAKIVYPEWRKCVPDAPKRYATPDAPSMLSVLGRFAALGNEFVVIQGRPEDEQLVLENVERHDGTKVKIRSVVISQDADGLDGETVVNPYFLAEAIRSAGPSSVMLGKAKPMVIVRSAPGATVAVTVLLMEARG